MKIRSGFVSNSSSSSFIIGVLKEPVPCPTCHRCSPSIEDIFEAGKSDSEVVYTEIDSLIKELQRELSKCNYRLQELLLPSTPKNYWYKTKEGQINFIKAGIEELNKNIKRVKEWKKDYQRVLFVNVDYHDSYVNQTLGQMIENNEIVMEEFYEN